MAFLALKLTFNFHFATNTSFPLKSDFEREVLRQLWDWKSELELNNDIPDASEVAEMRQKIEEQLRNKESSRSEL